MRERSGGLSPWKDSSATLANEPGERQCDFGKRCGRAGRRKDALDYGRDSRCRRDIAVGYVARAIKASSQHCCAPHAGGCSEAAEQ